MASPIAAAGGVITNIGSSTIHTFTSSGVFQPLTRNGSTSTPLTVSYLVVGGGASGGRDNSSSGLGGGGGAGGFLTSSGFAVTPGTAYAITVGAGGAAIGAAATGVGNNGNISAILAPNETTYSGFFNGSAQYLTVANNTVLAFGTGDFTVECWVYPTATTQGTVLWLTTTFQFFVYNGSLYIYDNGTQTNGGTITKNQWQHIAITRNGTSLKCFINGALVNTQVSSTSFVSGTNYIGNQGGTYLFGYISNLRVIKGTALYTSAFTPPTRILTAAAPSLYGISFSGTTQYLTGPALASNQLTADFTIECWINPTSVPSHTGIITITNTASSGANGCAIGITTTNAVEFFIAGNTFYASANNVLTLNQWQHIALVRSGTTNTLYLNGISVVTNTVTPTWPATPTISVGRLYADNSIANFPGAISNVRITKGVAVYTGNFSPPTTNLSTTQSSGTNISAISTASYVILLTAQSNTIVDNSISPQILTVTGSPTVISTVTVWSASLLTLQNDTFIDNSVNNLTITPTGSPTTTSTVVPPFGQYAYGGGGGAAFNTGPGNAGGSGGGGDGTQIAGVGTTGQGFAGGAPYWTGTGASSAGGGGGASANGTSGASNQGGAGGAGSTSTLSGVSTYYAGGGGGAAYFAGGWGAGGVGGGGKGAVNTTSVSVDGTSNTGGGGGGGGNFGSGQSGAGGSGIVIISYPNPAYTAPLTKQSDPYFKSNSLLLTGNTLQPVSISVDYLVVGGGGGGGTGANTNNDYTGGGGAGGLVTTSTILTNNAIYTIQIGAGGLGGALNSNGTSGNNSSITSTTITSVIALGGGYGGTKDTAGGYGGSGGGGGGTTTGGAGGLGVQPLSPSGGFGNAGYAGQTSTQPGGGGGGGAGGAALGNANPGAGLYVANFSAYGESGYFASGGAGAKNGSAGNNSGQYALGGGGGFSSNGLWGGGAGVPRSAMTATGGGGALQMPGGSGTVIIRHPSNYSVASTTGSPTIVTTSGYVYYSWTTSGSIELQAYNLTNTSFIDSSVNTLTITSTVGTPTQGSFSPFGQNWSNYFNGSSYLSIPSNSAFAFTGNFTFESWVYVSAYGSTSAFFTIGSETTGRYYFTLTGSGGQLWSNQYGGANFTWGTSTSVPLNAWTHVAWVRVGTTVTGYVNGISVGTNTISGTVGNTGGVTIGANPAGGYLWNGYMSNIRLIGTAVYTNNFTPATAPLPMVTNTVLLTAASNRFMDKSGTTSTFTVGGTPSVQRFSPFNNLGAYNTTLIGGSAYFNGSSYLSNTSGSIVNFGTSAFTWEAWLYMPSNANNQIILYATSGAGSFNVITQASGLCWGIYGNPSFFFCTLANIPLNQWFHLAVSRVSTSANQTFGYINGSLVVTATDTNNYTGIGARIGGDGTYYTGYMSNMRIVRGTALYTAAFTPPAAPVGTINTTTSTSLLLKFNDAGIYDATMNNDVVAVGSAKLSSTATNYNPRSMYFNGSTDYLLMPSSSAYNLGSGDFTMECWIYPTTVVSNGIFGIGSTDPDSNLVRIGSGSKLQFWLGGSNSGGTGAGTKTGMITCATTLVVNTWYHIALVRSDSATNNVKLYLNGVLDGQGTATYFIASNYAVLGRDYPTYSAEYFAGYIDDFRITKGVARYTAAFTPPTQTLLLR